MEKSHSFNLVITSSNIFGMYRVFFLVCFFLVFLSSILGQTNSTTHIIQIYDDTIRNYVTDDSIIIEKVVKDTTTFESFYFYTILCNTLKDSTISSYTFKNPNDEIELIVQYRVGRLQKQELLWPSQIFKLYKSVTDSIIEKNTPIDYTEFIFVKSFQKFEIKGVMPIDSIIKLLIKNKIINRLVGRNFITGGIDYCNVRKCEKLFGNLFTTMNLTKVGVKISMTEKMILKV